MEELYEIDEDLFVSVLREELEELEEKKKRRKKGRGYKKSGRKKKKKKSKGKKDACYHKVKARYDVWPSAYASGALVKCRKVGAANWGNKSKKKNEGIEFDDHLLQIIKEEYAAVIAEKKKLTAKPSSESSLKDWFGRKGAPGKKGGWVDCNTCRKDKKTGRKKCSPCGRSGKEKRSKYPSCRPTPGACGKRGKWGKKSKAGKKG